MEIYLYVAFSVLLILFLLRAFSPQIYDVIIIHMTTKWYAAFFKKIASSENNSPAREMSIYELGLTLTVINDKVRQRFKLEKGTKGVVITKVDDKGPTSQKEIRPGDIITEVSQQKISTPADVERKVANAIQANRKSVLLHLDGQNGLRFVAVRLRKK